MNNEIREEIDDAFINIKQFFPFSNYMTESKLPKYRMIIAKIVKYCPKGSSILSIGAGPCDLEAILSKMGYEITAIDDLSDHWHVIGKNRERIQNFAKDMNIILTTERIEISNVPQKKFDAVILVDVVEHIHGSPKDLLNCAISVLKPGGIILIGVPNTANLKNRLSVLFGKSNQQNIIFIFWNIGEYRSHFREYTKYELYEIMKKINLTEIEVDALNIRTRMLYYSTENLINKILILVYGLISEIYPNFRDTLLAIGKKPSDWVPIQDSIIKFKKCYDLIERNNLDRLSDDELLRQLSKKGA